MDVPPIADATPDHLVAPRPPSPVPSVDRRLEMLEAGVADMAERLDALAVSLEASVRVAVAQEVQAASGELRHTVAELGRLLVRDLGKLSKILSDHRDAIVAELRAPGDTSAPGPTGPGSAPAPDAGPRDLAGGGQPPGDDIVGDRGGDTGSPHEPADAAGDRDPAGDSSDSTERQRRSLLRRRQG